MISEMSKRFLSFLLAMLMVVSMVPAQVFATELDEHDHDHGEAIVEQQEGEETEPEATDACLKLALFSLVRVSLLCMYLSPT